MSKISEFQVETLNFKDAVNKIGKTLPIFLEIIEVGGLHLSNDMEIDNLFRSLSEMRNRHENIVDKVPTF